MEYSLEWMVIVSTLVIASMVGFVVLLMVLNTNRRLRHRAELAEVERTRRAEVADAELEAVRQTLHDVGRELHDNIGQLLVVAQMGVYTLMEDKPDPRLNEVSEMLTRSMDEMRRLAHSLDASIWERRPLVDAIGTEAQRLERVGRLRAHVIHAGQPFTIDPDTGIILFRVFQEVVSNVLKHSGADLLTITLNGDSPISITIADNGRGFDAANTVGNAGLFAIRRRCALIGFDARCTSTRDNGCTWTLTQNPTHGAPGSIGR